jgi:DNA-directed RNA polymerase subunit RPC12/RpoP
LEHDGTFQCGRCKTALNETDANCWRCGSTNIVDLRPKPTVVEDFVIAEQGSIEDLLRVWNEQLTGTTSATIGPITWNIST